MELPPDPPTRQPARQTADTLFRAGDAIVGKNLRKSSWREIADVVVAQGRLQTIVWERLRGARTRDDVLRVLRIVRKDDPGGKRRGHSSATAARKRSRTRSDKIGDHEPNPACPSCGSPYCAWMPPTGFFWGFELGSAQCEDRLRYSDNNEEELDADVLWWYRATRSIDALVGYRQNSGRGQDVHFIRPGTAAKQYPEFMEGPLEVRLHNWFQYFQNPDHDLTPILRDCMGSPDAVLDRLQLSRYHPIPDLVVMLCLYAPFWIRSPESWQPSEDDARELYTYWQTRRRGEGRWLDSRRIRQIISEFSHHLFVSRPIPACLRDGRHFKWHCVSKEHLWFILIGQGASLKRAARHFGWTVPGAFEASLHRIPHQFQGCVRTLAEIIRLGGGPIEYNRINGIDGPYSEREPTNSGQRESDPQYWKFWTATVRWLTAHREELSDRVARTIMEWARHEQSEAERDGREFEWKGRTVRSSTRHANEYAEQLRAARERWNEGERARRERRTSAEHATEWSGHGFDWTLSDPKGRTFVFQELTTLGQLIDEGEALHHCVATYAQRCASGRSAIVSLQQDGCRSVTVEVELETRKVIQIRGSHNRRPNSLEERVIGEWWAAMTRPAAATSDEQSAT